MPQRPAFDRIIHVALTVTDLEASVAWYRTVLGFEEVTTIPHPGGAGSIMRTRDPEVWLALHHHERNDGGPFDETRTGLDHLALLLPALEDLDRWRHWLDDHRVPHDDIQRFEDLGFAVMVFRDPDHIPLELVAPLSGPAP